MPLSIRAKVVVGLLVAAASITGTIVGIALAPQHRHERKLRCFVPARSPPGPRTPPPLLPSYPLSPGKLAIRRTRLPAGDGVGRARPSVGVWRPVHRQHGHGVVRILPPGENLRLSLSLPAAPRNPTVTVVRFGGPANRPERQAENFHFFIRHGLQTNVDYVFTINGDAPAEILAAIPRLGNIFIIHKDN
ncbi:MAG: hypothetical protein BJ554DRAFT_685, partial [Olpidium bornovanus]